MFRELSRLEEQFPGNVRNGPAEIRYDLGVAPPCCRCCWHCMKELLELSHWHWDFVLNLSESDYPMKPVSQLVTYLTSNKGRNFVRSHGRETSVFVRKQGLDRAFYECENHMWRLGPRELPAGIQIDGGSDWICLHKEFVDYVVHGHDEMIDGLRQYFQFALLPAESFFHVALRNSRFCSTTINNNLHLTNWKRKQGCKCQHKVVVDWCGCSPNDFKPEDWDKINATAKRDTFFARKFEAIVNQKVINRVDEWLTGPDYDYGLAARHDYWENYYHHHDSSPKARPEALTLVQSLAEAHLGSVLDAGYKFEKVLEVTAYNHREALEGILILYEAKDSQAEGQQVVEIEVLVKPDPYSAEAAADTTHDPMHFSVGTDFDPKEVLFRNKLGAIGPNSDPCIMYRLEGGFSDPLTFLLFDPAGQAVHVEKKSFPNGTHEDIIQPELSKPLLPGVWSLLVLQGGKTEGSMFAKVRFLVTPLGPDAGNFSDEELARLHSGPKVPADLGADLSTLFASVFLPDAANLGALKAKAEELKNLRGADLTERIRDLNKDFYQVIKCCQADDRPLLRTRESSLPACRTEAWSSRTEDPKSTITSLDHKTGRLL